MVVHTLVYAHFPTNTFLGSTTPDTLNSGYKNNYSRLNGSIRQNLIDLMTLYHHYINTKIYSSQLQRIEEKSMKTPWMGLIFKEYKYEQMGRMRTFKVKLFKMIRKWFEEIFWILEWFKGKLLYWNVLNLYL